MIRILALILTIGGMIALVLGVLGIFGNDFTSLSPWALTILGGGCLYVKIQERRTNKLSYDYRIITFSYRHSCAQS